MRRIPTYFAALALLAGTVRGEDAPAPAPDAFEEALRSAGLTEADLGFREKASWPRWPHSIPFKMPFFDDLLARPTDVYPFVRTLANPVEDLLTTASLSTPPKEGPGSLYRLGVVLGTDRRIGGMRGFGFGLYDPKPAPQDPLADALVRLLMAAGAGSGADPVALRAASEGVPEPLRLPLARLVLALIDARQWIDTGLRRVTPAERAAVFREVSGLLEATPDATRYVPAFEDAARALDEPSLHYGCLKALEAVQRARWDIAAAPRPEAGWPEFEVRIASPWGTVLFDNNPVNTQSADAPFLVVRVDASNNWSGPIASTGVDRPLSVALLMDQGQRVGEDYGVDVQAPPRTAGEVAAGILGCGVLYVAGTRNNYYKADRLSLGCGVLGMGVLVDEGGDDEYWSSTGQGAGVFGAGLLLDAGGKDAYTLLEGDGQGYGGPGGIGVLADREGDDHYYAEPRPARAGKDRADYHSDQKIVGSNAQGVGMGRRGDVSDGHSWAGGLGALIDVDGNDVYEAGNFSQACGYWFGTGVLWDGGGDDTYRSVYFSHASGAHFAIGALVDEGGDDRHHLGDWPGVGLGRKAGAGLAFGWDVVVAILHERAGNDVYEGDIISEGCANVRSQAFLLDEGGDDVYVADEGAAAFGAIDEREDYAVPARGSWFTYELGQIGMLLDLGGKDRYLRTPAKGDASLPDALAGDGKSWGRDGPRGPRGAWNVARGRDVVRGRIGFLDAWPRRLPK
jgi:hypothetical protein